MGWVWYLLLVFERVAGGHPTSANCTTHFLEQYVDHFRFTGPPSPTYRQRYFVYDAYWNPTVGSTPPVFYYCGNEDDVTLYVNNTGLMWENAKAFGALLVFGEHRYYGESMPFPDGTPGCMDWLTTEQATADYAVLIEHIRSAYKVPLGSAVIGFGGSYGGMLGAWMRMKYPNALDGMIAASAPIWSFTGLTPPYDYNSFDEGVTFDATPAGGSVDRCSVNFRAALPEIARMAASPTGRQVLSQAFRTCHPLTSYADAYGLVGWVQGPWGYLAMGNYPYPSGYIIHGKGLLPAWPLRKACSYLGGHFPTWETTFEAMREAVGVYYNHTLKVPCFYNGDTEEFRPPHQKMGPLWTSVGRGPVSSGSCRGNWGYQWCTEMTQPFTSGVGKDMFWPGSVFNLTSSIEGCVSGWGVAPRADWAAVGLLGKRIGSASNIVFSNGGLDPWHGGGVLKDVSPDLTAVFLPNGAHHLDLMFSNPVDPPDARAAREHELSHIAKWIRQRAARYAV